MLKAAVIGVGSIGQNHARVYREMDGVELVGVADAFPLPPPKLATASTSPFIVMLTGCLMSKNLIS